MSISESLALHEAGHIAASMILLRQDGQLTRESDGFNAGTPFYQDLWHIERPGAVHIVTTLLLAGRVGELAGTSDRVNYESLFGDGDIAEGDHEILDALLGLGFTKVEHLDWQIDVLQYLFAEKVDIAKFAGLLRAKMGALKVGATLKIPRSALLPYLYASPLRAV